VVVLLLDLVTGKALARAGAFNDQIRFGIMSSRESMSGAILRC